MARTIGLDLIGNRLLAVELDGRGQSLQASFIADLPDKLNAANAPSLGNWLREQFASHGLKGSDVAWTLGRERVTLKTCDLPECPANELPAIVAFEAEDSWSQQTEPVIDFQASPASNGLQRVSAAMAPAPLVETLRKISEEAGLNCRHIGLRPHATHAAWKMWSESADKSNVLLAVPGDESLELSVWEGDQLELCRSMPLAGHDVTKHCVAEIRRTLVSHHANRSEQVNHVVVCAPNHLSLFEALQDALPQTVERFDLTQVLDVGDKPLNPGVVAAVGAARQLKGAAHWPVDLLNPKKTVVQRDQTKTLAALAAALIVLFAGGGYAYFRSQMSIKDKQIELYSNQVAELTAKLKEAKPYQERHEDITAWRNAGRNWMLELQEFAAHMPDTTDAYLTSMDLSAGNGRVPAKIVIDGRSKSQDVVSRAQRRLVQEELEHYHIAPRRLEEVENAPSDYNYAFGVDVSVGSLPENDDELISRWEKVKTELTETLKQKKLRRTPVDAVDTVRRVVTRAPSRSSRPSSSKPAESPEESESKPQAKPSTSGTTASAESKSDSSADDSKSSGDALIDKLVKMSFEEREKYIKENVPKFLQNRTREKVKEALR